MARGKILDVALAVFLAAVLASSLAVDFGPGEDLALGGRDLGPGCFSRHLTGVECPFCGISHSFVALADGDVAASFAYHPLGPVLVALFVAFIGAVFVAFRRRSEPVVESRVFTVLTTTLLVTSLVVWGTRTLLMVG